MQHACNSWDDQGNDGRQIDRRSVAAKWLPAPRSSRNIRWTMLAAPVAIAMFASTSGCDMGLGTTWVESEELLELSPAEVRQLALYTPNGEVRVVGDSKPDAVIQLRTTIRAGGLSREDAQQCLEAIEVLTPLIESDQVQEVRWDWNKPRRLHWKAVVSYEVSMPRQIDLKVDASNGQIYAEQVTGDCELVTRNGGVKTRDAGGQRFEATTYNGQLDISSPATSVLLKTYNGAVEASLTNPTRLEGSISSYNGSVKVALDPRTAVEISCRTRNGRLTNELPLTDLLNQAKRLRGKLGAGGESLDIETYNGSIRLQAIEPEAHE